jgi:hypothetical protein
MLVAEHVWDDPKFAEAARLLSLVPGRVWLPLEEGERRRRNCGGVDGGDSGDGSSQRQERNRRVEMDPGEYVGEHVVVERPGEGGQSVQVRHGVGRCVYQHGRVYEGEWWNGVIHGRGTMTWTKSGRSYVGEWEGGKKHGVGTFTFYNGRKYTGKFENGTPMDQESLDAARDGREPKNKR